MEKSLNQRWKESNTTLSYKEWRRREDDKMASFDGLSATKEKVVGTSKPTRGSETQVLFLRSISLSEESSNPIGAERIITMALDELDRAVLDARVSDSASSRLFVNILATDQGVNLSQTLTKFRSVGGPLS